MKKTAFAKFKKKVFADAALVADFIYQIGETESLRKPSIEIPVNKIKTAEYIKKFKYLKSCLKKYKKLTGMGRGIAGVQVGIPENFFVIFTPDNKLLLVINPKITKASKEKLKYPEMCMSANPLIAPVIRPAWIEFEYLDENAKLQFWNTKADVKDGKILNRVFQHEIDHLSGIINIDLCDSKDLILYSDPKYYADTNFETVN